MHLFPGNRDFPTLCNGVAEPVGAGTEPDDNVAGPDQYVGVGGLLPGDGANLAVDQSGRIVGGIYQHVVGNHLGGEPTDEGAVTRPPEKRIPVGIKLADGVQKACLTQ